MRSSITEDTDTLFRAIGMVVVEFQRTERSLTEALGTLLKVKDEGGKNILFAALSFGQKVDLFAALHRQNQDHEKTRICEGACRYLKSAEEFRNTVVHSDYFAVSGKKTVRWAEKKVSIRGAKGVRVRKKLVDLSFIIKGANVMKSLWLEATSFDFLASYDHGLELKLKNGAERLKKKPIK